MSKPLAPSMPTERQIQEAQKTVATLYPRGIQVHPIRNLWIDKCWKMGFPPSDVISSLMEATD